VRIGLAHGSDVRLSDRTVSRCHAIVTLRDDRYVIRDDASTNGTFVEGVRIVEAFIAPGMKVRMGDTTLVFRTDHRIVEVGEGERFGAMTGQTAAMRRLFAVLEKIAPTTLTCLVVGETGTGKEVAARAIHDKSGRGGPFVVVDCASLHPELVEAELFGYERGAFTGADRAQPGAFERAEGGTIFLDEIGELPLSVQPKLLRVLERRELKRLGASTLVDVDVRIVAATHKDLAAMCGEGTFRDDLYYRVGEMSARATSPRSRTSSSPSTAATSSRATRSSTWSRGRGRATSASSATSSAAPLPSAHSTAPGGSTAQCSPRSTSHLQRPRRRSTEYRSKKGAPSARRGEPGSPRSSART
jgi:transcriptional regulator of acetoin/glycerol metabolism